MYYKNTCILVETHNKVLKKQSIFRRYTESCHSNCSSHAEKSRFPFKLRFRGFFREESFRSNCAGLPQERRFVGAPKLLGQGEKQYSEAKQSRVT